MKMRHWLLTLVVAVALAACGSAGNTSGADGGDQDGKADNPNGYNQLNLAAGTMVLYEVQARTANACRTDVGSTAQRQACSAKVYPTIPYRAQGMTCSDLAELKKIRLGTLDDLQEDGTDFRQGITLRYIGDRVGATTVWLMPVFPDNDTWNIPDACDNLGSPYAVRDYYHVQGTLSRSCIQQGRDEHDDPACWGNDALDALIAQAHSRGMKVMLDLAFNHFGHNYTMYDTVDFRPIRERIASGENLDGLWNYGTTYDSGLLHPEILESVDQLNQLAQHTGLHKTNLQALKQRCPNLSGAALVQAYNAWRDALDWERAQFPCDTSYLEYAAPGFYLGSDSYNPSTGAGDNFSNNWVDVKFLYHHEENVAHKHEFYREREYLFRVMNYWNSRGVDGFRLDHTTDFNSGMGPNEWKYIVSKVDYYAYRRGQARPVYLAEEFGDQMGMSKVVDVMTEGYVGDMCGRNGVTKDAAHVESVVQNENRFQGHTYVLTALETHDEKRLTDGTGFDIWTGAGFWGVGATTWSTPMLLMGQEFGEPEQLAFRKSDFLRGRFEGTAEFNAQADALVDYYHAMITARLAQPNRALYSSLYQFLRTRDSDSIDPRLFAMAKWSKDGNVVFVFHNLWEQSVAQSYYIPPSLGSLLSISDSKRYRLVDVLSGSQLGSCQSGADLKWNLYVAMDAGTRFQWARLELCN